MLVKYVSKLVLIASTTKAAVVPKFDANGKAIPGEFLTTREDLELRNADIHKTLADHDYTKLEFGIITNLSRYILTANWCHNRFYE